MFSTRLQISALLAVLLAATVIPASADVNVLNGNFSQGLGLGAPNVGNAPNDAPGSYTGINYDSSLSSYAGYCSYCYISDWTVTPSVDWIGSYWTAPDAAGKLGGYSVDLDGLEAAGSISQKVAGLTVGDYYTLSFYLNGNSDGPPDPKNLTVSVVGGNPSSESYTPTPYVPADQSLSLWSHEIYGFTAESNSVTVTFASTDPPQPGTYGTSFGPVIAGVSLTPEPGFYGILAIGLIGLTFALRRRRAA